MNLTTHNPVNLEGELTAGWVHGIGLEIHWQNGPLEDDARNGALLADGLEACLQRLNAYQETRLSCRENEMAIIKIREALHWLGARQQDRQLRGVQHTYET